MKNIDVVRHLKPKELAQFMEHQICNGCDCCTNQVEKGTCTFPLETITSKACTRGIIRWLKQKYNPNDRIWEAMKNE
jgi:hypothetical protein